MTRGRDNRDVHRAFGNCLQRKKGDEKNGRVARVCALSGPVSVRNSVIHVVDTNSW